MGYFKISNSSANLSHLILAPVRPSMPETTALGAAMAAGAAEGIGVWNIEQGQATNITTDVFTPSVPRSGRGLDQHDAWCNS